jgi:hypothetical protein
MKKIIALVLLAGWFGTGMAQTADPAKDIGAAPFTLFLMDGSEMKATLGVANFTLETDLGTITVPVEKISSISLKPDKGTAVFKLLDGDQLTGKLAIMELPVTTLMGDVKIKFANIKSMKAKTDVAKFEGSWMMAGPRNRGQRCSITQTDDGVKLTNEMGEASRGSLISETVISADEWHLTGKLSDDGKRIDWSNGTYWTRPNDDSQF